MKHPERVHSRSHLLDRVWGDHVFIEERTVDVHIKRLREALAPADCAAMIETVRGAGYRFTAGITSPTEHRWRRAAGALGDAGTSHDLPAGAACGPVAGPGTGRLAGPLDGRLLALVAGLGGLGVVLRWGWC
jgi:hypothetical protein